MNSLLSRTRTRLLATAGAALAVVVLAGCSSDHNSMSGTSHGASPSTSGTPSYGPAATGPHNAQDITFATDMIPHHTQAVEMAEMALTRETDAGVKALAAQIKGAQAPEIAQMGGWLRGWGSTIPTGSGMSGHRGGMTAGNGMMSSDEMTQLDAASGNEFAKLFLTGMTQHHRGAVAMAKTELAAGQSSEAKALASEIITAQNTEIATMAELLAKLGG